MRERLYGGSAGSSVHQEQGRNGRDGPHQVPSFSFFLLQGHRGHQCPRGHQRHRRHQRHPPDQGCSRSGDQDQQCHCAHGGDVCRDGRGVYRDALQDHRGDQRRPGDQDQQCDRGQGLDCYPDSSAR